MDEIIKTDSKDHLFALLAERSEALMDMYALPYDLNEMKLVDCYLGLINARDSKSRFVSFSKAEFEKFIGVKRIRADVLKKNVNKLADKINFSWQDDQVLNINLFEVSSLVMNNDKTYTIMLSSTEIGEKFFFNLSRYNAYWLSEIRFIKRESSYLLFLYLVKNAFRREWAEIVEEMKKYLRCDFQEEYKEYKHFKQKILLPAIKEINEKTYFHVGVSNVMKGTSVVAIKFKCSRRTPVIASGETKLKYGQYQNVLLTEQELTVLKRDFPNYNQVLERLSEYLYQHPNIHYAHHFEKIKQWVKEDKEKKEQQQNDRKGSYFVQSGMPHMSYAEWDAAAKPAPDEDDDDDVPPWLIDETKE